MNIDELADHFDRVKMTASGFTARCPAHNDTSPSLSINEGHTSYLVACHVGCNFFDIVDAAGLHPLNFKIGDAWTNESSQHLVGVKARDRMREMRGAKGRILTTFADIVEVALQPDVDRMVDVTDRWQLMGLQFEAAMKMHHIVIDGPVFELLHMGQLDRFVKDWDEEKRLIRRDLWRTYRQHGPR